MSSRVRDTARQEFITAKKRRQRSNWTCDTHETKTAPGGTQLVSHPLRCSGKRLVARSLQDHTQDSRTHTPIPRVGMLGLNGRKDHRVHFGRTYPKANSEHICEHLGPPAWAMGVRNWVLLTEWDRPRCEPAGSAWPVEISFRCHRMTPCVVTLNPFQAILDRFIRRLIPQIL